MISSHIMYFSFYYYSSERFKSRTEEAINSFTMMFYFIIITIYINIFFFKPFREKKTIKALCGRYAFNYKLDIDRISYVLEMECF